MKKMKNYTLDYKLITCWLNLWTRLAPIPLSSATEHSGLISLNSKTMWCKTSNKMSATRVSLFFFYICDIWHLWFVYTMCFKFQRVLICSTCLAAAAYQEKMSVVVDSCYELIPNFRGLDSPMCSGTIDKGLELIKTSVNSNLLLWRLVRL